MQTGTGAPSTAARLNQRLRAPQPDPTGGRHRSAYPQIAGRRLPDLHSGDRCRGDQALYTVIMGAYVDGVQTGRLDALVSALGSQGGNSKS